MDAEGQAPNSEACRGFEAPETRQRAGFHTSPSCPVEGGPWGLRARRDVQWGVEGGWDRWGELWAWGEIDCLPLGDNLIYIQTLPI